MTADLFGPAVECNSLPLAAEDDLTRMLRELLAEVRALRAACSRCCACPPLDHHHERLDQ